jgi:hypothetical protein
MLHGRDKQDSARLAFADFKALDGRFGRAQALQDASTMAPWKWWEMYGGHAPELKYVAIRVLSQVSLLGNCSLQLKPPRQQWQRPQQGWKQHLQLKQQGQQQQPHQQQQQQQHVFGSFGWS